MDGSRGCCQSSVSGPEREAEISVDETPGVTPGFERFTKLGHTQSLADNAINE